MGPRLLLGLSAAVWLPYGLYCFIAPESLNANAGVSFVNSTGATEIRAMYGGLQIAIGALCALGFTRIEWRPVAVGTLFVLTAGLLSTRLIGISLDGSLSGYTIGACLFEALTAGFAARYLELRSE